MKLFSLIYRTRGTCERIDSNVWIFLVSTGTLTVSKKRIAENRSLIFPWISFACSSKFVLSLEKEPKSVKIEKFFTTSEVFPNGRLKSDKLFYRRIFRNSKLLLVSSDLKV
ncbi:hypothetical protein LEP1GSC036_3325 [Leptospira weilii str. 2006001853]|uniref:Uncharacterized protein n=1 Tax=Leptospira weilii str. 2006001853 TaxID=1001589 RepID=A0A828Z2Z3_9LEPT|nr:hypothetical protein [Leptospira weilii]EKR64705.1 hypothetical protein LEP1GSC036_3325 [Leptospira weilii str. 2006001853]